jgi:CHAT domain-containing protein
MVPGWCRCSRAILRLLVLMIVLSGLLVLPFGLASLNEQGGKTALRLSPLTAQAVPDLAQTEKTSTQILRLVPDNSTALANQHFKQAQLEMRADNLSAAQGEIEQSLSLTELQYGKECDSEDRNTRLATLREYYEWYIELQMQRERRHPHGEFAARAWQAGERMHWWSANAAGKTPAQVPVLTLVQLQQQLLDEQSLLLAYSLGAERSYLWAIAKHEFRWFELPDRQTIEAKAVRLHRWLSKQPESAANGLADEAAGLAEELGELLLQPAAAQLSGRRLLVVADGALQQLPFGVLPEPSSRSAGGRRMTEGKNAKAELQPLIFEHEIVNWPAATTVWWRQQRNRVEPDASLYAQEATVAVIADPVFGKYDERLLARLGADAKPAEQSNIPLLDDVLARLRNWDLVKYLKLTRAEQQILLARLPQARSEAEAIAGIAPRSVQWLDFAANRAAALQGLLSDYPVIHFATHGFFNRRAPALSGLVLSQVNEQGDAINGLLLSQEIGALQLKAELVVVSACESALAETGGNSLAHSFLQAGARRVVASLWKVNDAATAELMRRFYRRLFNSRKWSNMTLASPSAALRAAQLEMWQETRWQQPFYWAAFVLQGER